MSLSNLQHAAEDLSAYLEEQQDLTERFPVDGKYTAVRLAVEDNSKHVFATELSQQEASALVEWLHQVYITRIETQKKLLKEELNDESSSK